MATSLATRKKKVMSVYKNIKNLIDINKFTEKQSKLLVFTYLNCLERNKTTEDVVYRITLLRGGTSKQMLNELLNFAQRK